MPEACESAACSSASNGSDAVGEDYYRALAEIFNALPERVVRYARADRRILYCNEAWAAVRGKAPHDMVGQRLDDILTEPELEGMRAQLDKIGPDNLVVIDDEPRPAPNAPGRWVAWADKYLPGDNGGDILAVGRDVTDRYLAEQARAASEERFRQLADGSADVVWRFSAEPSPHFSYVSPSLEKLTGLQPTELHTGVGAMLRLLDEPGRALVMSALRGGPVPSRFDLRFSQPDGTTTIGEMQVAQLQDGFQGIGRDVTEIRTLQDQLAGLALRDPLTGLANRRLLEELLDAALQRTQRADEPLTVSYLDLDDFKAINDIYGHAAGDVVLQATADRLLGAVRASDVVARVGGDEFVIVHEPSDMHLQGLTDRLDAALAIEIPLAHGAAVICGASIGQADARTTAPDALALIAAADAAMYEVKRQRKAGQIAAR
jgi:diguanylate cyclase (GGDEF)-like protein/PAS domain S-box-containing protein